MTTMQTERRSLITRQFFSLLPVQILIIAIGCLNSIVDGVIASSSIRPDAVAVLGLYADSVRSFPREKRRKGDPVGFLSGY